MPTDGGETSGATIYETSFNGVGVTDSDGWKTRKCGVGSLNKCAPETTVLVIHSVQQPHSGVTGLMEQCISNSLR